MKKVQEGEKLRNISKDTMGIFGPGSTYGGKSEDLAKFNFLSKIMREVYEFSMITRLKKDMLIMMPPTVA